MAYKLFPCFAFRSPLLSMNEQFLESDRNSFVSQFSNPQTAEAIYLASPVLYREIQKTASAQITDNKETDRIIHAYWRYFCRMHTRCTPFGLFAGCGLGETGKETKICLKNTCKRKTRLDMLYLCALYDALIKMPDIKSTINYYPNSSLYLSGKNYRYVEAINLHARLKYHISEAERSVYLNKILKVVTQGADLHTLVNCLVSDTVSKEDALDFINNLIESQVITGELNKAITGEDYYDRIIHLIESINKNNQILPLLKEIRCEIERLDHENTGVESYKHILLLVKNMEAPYEENSLFQVDMIRETSSASLSDRIVNELKSAMGFLNRIQGFWKNEVLDKFKQDFYSRYEDKEVPLMEALDSESGLGYPSKSRDGDPAPLVDDLILPQKNEETATFSNKFHSLLSEKAMECLLKNKQEIAFSDDDIKDFTLNWSDLPATIYTVFEIIRDNPTDMLIRLEFFSGSGANLLARFAHADEKIDKFVKEIAAKEQSYRPDAILAEIVHLPEARIGNVLFRPHIREYEIVYLASSDMPCERILNVSDLMLSVRNNRLFIRSRNSDKEIIPHLTTAHVYHRGLPVYRFLCDMQKQSGRYGLSFNWGAYSHYFRPRVRYKNTILSPAAWIIGQDKIKHLFLIKDHEQLVLEVDQWRNTYEMPRFVQMVESDNKLWVDWKNVLRIRSLFSIIKNKPSITFTEFLFEPENAVVKDEDGNVYPNECIAVFYKENK